MFDVVLVLVAGVIGLKDARQDASEGAHQSSLDCPSPGWLAARWKARVQHACMRGTKAASCGGSVPRLWSRPVGLEA